MRQKERNEKLKEITEEDSYESSVRSSSEPREISNTYPVPKLLKIPPEQEPSKTLHTNLSRNETETRLYPLCDSCNFYQEVPPEDKLLISASQMNAEM